MLFRLWGGGRGVFAWSPWGHLSQLQQHSQQLLWGILWRGQTSVGNKQSLNWHQKTSTFPQRLTIIESPSDSAEQEDDFGQFSLGSPEYSDDLYDSEELVGGVKVVQTAHACEECFKTFSSPGKLKQHEYTHTGETPFECKIAGRKYLTIIINIALLIETNPPGCDKKFTSKFKLKRHVLIHSQTKTFLCDICKRAFRRKDHLKNHEKVTREKNKKNT